jgi:hypothetical protein
MQERERSIRAAERDRCTAPFPRISHPAIGWDMRICSAMTRDSYEAASEALHWVRASFLQMTRYVDNFVAYAEAQSGGSDESQEADTAATNTVADAHFLLNACAQAEKALRRYGRPLSDDRKVTIRALRDVHEHWEQHKKSFESRKHAKSRSGKRFNDAHPDHIPWNFRFDGSGTWISALRLEDLWSELASIEVELWEALNSYHTSVGLPALPALEPRAELVRRESRVLGMAMSTQNLVIDFD